MLQLANVVKKLPNGRALLNGINLHVGAGEFVGILGPSGAGKSLTIRCLLGLTKADQGTILFEPETAGAYDMTTRSARLLRRARRQIGVVFQDFNLVDRLSVLENVLIGRLGWINPIRSWLYGFTEEEARGALVALQSVRMESFAQRWAGTLSRGEMQRVALARAIFQRPALFVVDEPISSVDPGNAQAIMETLAELARQTPVLGAFHQPEMTARYCSRVIGIRHGVVVYDGSPQLSRQQHEQIYGSLDASQPTSPA